MIITCRNNVRIPSTSFIVTNNPHLDLAILSISSHNVIDYGTFGVWVGTLFSLTGRQFRVTQGGYLSGGDVVLPESATVKYKKFATILNWTVLAGF